MRLDADGYPSGEQLEVIRTWDCIKGDLDELLEYVRQLWWPDGEYGFQRKGTRLWLSTGGWSGNEDVILALKRNLLFWSLRWDAAWRGGHYRFRDLPKPGEKRPGWRPSPAPDAGGAA